MTGQSIGPEVVRFARRGLVRRTFVLSAVGAALSAVACTAPSTAPTTAPASPPPATPKPADAKPAATAPPAPTAPAKPAAAPTTQAPAKPATMHKVRASMIDGVFENSYVLLGHDKGFFREFGVEPEFTFFQGGTAMVTGLLSNELEYGHTVGYMTAVEKGGDIKMIGYSKPRLSFVLYVRKDINKLEELVGKSFGTAAPGALTHVITVALLEQHGIDPAKVEMVNIGSSPSIFKAIVAGKVDAGASTPDFIPVAEAEGLKPLLNFSEALPKYGQVALIASGKEITERPDAVQGMVNAWAKSYRYAIDQRNELIDFAAKLFSRPKEEVAFGHDYGIKLRIVNPDLTIDPANLEFMQQVNIRVEQQKTVLPFERLADARFQQKMIQTLGAYKWPA